MKAARLHAVGDLRISDEPVPVPGPGESLVKVTAIGICGSDLHWWDEAGIGDAVLRRPLVLGHEAAGVIADGPRQGERVAIDPAIPDNTCELCLRGYRNLCTGIVFAGHGDQDGAMREYLTWPSHLLPPLPESMSDAAGAVLEPLGVAIHASDLGHLHLGESAAVVGCGPIGLLLIEVLRATGAASVVAIEPLAHRREAALARGADVALDPAELGEPTAAGNSPALRAAVGELGVDVAFEIAGNDAGVQLAMAAVRPGGRVVLAGIPGDDWTRFLASVARRKGLTIAMVRRMNDVYPRAIGLATAGKVDLDSVVSDRFPLVKAPEAFATAARRDGLKVVIEA
jgi:L-iditol 2-dehydrogenase